MPTLDQATQPVDRSGLTPVAVSVAAPAALYAGQQYPPNPNPFLRCPIPPVSITPDSLRQYYQGGLIPQNRIMTPVSSAQAGAGTSGGSGTGITSVTNEITNTTIVTTKVGTIQSASVTTPVLSDGAMYQTTFSTSTSFIPLLISVTGAARVELYGTKAAQIADLSRLNTTPPGLGNEQSILLDVTVDTAPFVWVITPSLPAANSDSPQKPLSYITITNLMPASRAITATLRYLILQV